MWIRQTVHLRCLNWRKMIIFVQNYVDTIVAKFFPQFILKARSALMAVLCIFVVDKHSVLLKKKAVFFCIFYKKHAYLMSVFSPKFSRSIVAYFSTLLGISILLLFLEINPHFFGSWQKMSPLFLKQGFRLSTVPSHTAECPGFMKKRGVPLTSGTKKADF